MLPLLRYARVTNNTMFFSRGAVVQILARYHVIGGIVLVKSIYNDVERAIAVNNLELLPEDYNPHMADSTEDTAPAALQEVTSSRFYSGTRPLWIDSAMWATADDAAAMLGNESSPSVQE